MKTATAKKKKTQYDGNKIHLRARAGGNLSCVAIARTESGGRPHVLASRPRARRCTDHRRGFPIASQRDRRLIVVESARGARASGSSAWVARTLALNAVAPPASNESPAILI